MQRELTYGVPYLPTNIATQVLHTSSGCALASRVSVLPRPLRPDLSNHGAPRLSQLSSKGSPSIALHVFEAPDSCYCRTTHIACFTILTTLPCNPSPDRKDASLLSRSLATPKEKGWAKHEKAPTEQAKKDVTARYGLKRKADGATCKGQVPYLNRHV